MPTYLNVPFAEKDQAKGLGARWDAQKKQWFVPDNKPLQEFSKWLPPENEMSPMLIAPVYLRTSKESCYRCLKISHVYCLGATIIKDVEYDDDDGQPYSYLIRNTNNSPVDICNLADIDATLVNVIKENAPTYHPDFSKTQKATLWMNHCEHCNAKLGDFYMHNEPGGAFFPVSEKESAITDFLLYDTGEFSFNGGFSVK